MTRDDIIKLARESGMAQEFHGVFPTMERFAALVAASEREACAKVCEDNADDLSEGDWDPACNNCADKIRERVQA